MILSLPVIFYSCSIFTGAVRALRARTLDMMVLVAVAVGRVGLIRWLSPSPAAVKSSMRRRPFSPPSSCSVIGSRCEPGRRQRRDTHAAGSRTSQGACGPRRRYGGDPTSESGRTMLLVRPGEDRSRRDRRGRSARLTVHRHRRESRPSTRARLEVIGATINTSGTLQVAGHESRVDTALAQIVKAGPKNPRPQVRKSLIEPRRLVFVAHRWCRDFRRLGRSSVQSALDRGPLRDHRGRHHMPGRAGARDTDSDHGR